MKKKTYVVTNTRRRLYPN